MTWIADLQFIEDHYSGGFFSGGDEPDTFVALDGTKLHLNVPLCSHCDQPVDEHGYCENCALVEVEHLGPGRIAA